MRNVTNFSNLFSSQSNNYESTFPKILTLIIVNN